MCAWLEVRQATRRIERDARGASHRLNLRSSSYVQDDLGQAMRDGAARSIGTSFAFVASVSRGTYRAPV